MKDKIKTGILLIMLSMMFVLPAYAEDTDSWLDDWDYYVSSTNATNPMIKITGYKGDNTEAHIYGRVKIEGTYYNTTIYSYQSDAGGRIHFVSSFNNTENADIEDLYFHSVDGHPVIVKNGSSAKGLFWEMPKLRSIHFEDGIDFTDIYDVSCMFYGDENLEEVDLENLKFPEAVKAYQMFEGASALKNVTISFDRGSGFTGMLKDCTSLETVNISTNTSHPEWIRCNEMFKGCSSLKNVTLNGLNRGSFGTACNEMFSGCESLQSIDLTQIDLSGTQDCSKMFSGCKSLTSLDLSGNTWNSAGVNLSGLIENCPNLSELAVDESLVVSDATTGLGYCEKPSKIKITGSISDSFNSKIMGTLRDSNRYLEACDIKASVELTGDERYDRQSYGLEISGEDHVRIMDHDGSGGVYFSSGDHGIYFFEPGEYTLTLTQGTRMTDPVTGEEAVEALSEAEDYKSGENPLTKTIRVSRSEDGSIDIEEI